MRSSLASISVAKLDGLVLQAETMQECKVLFLAGSLQREEKRYCQFTGFPEP